MPTYKHTIIPGVTDTYSHTIDFPYLRTTDVRVYIDNALETEGSGANKYIFSNGGLDVTWEDGSEPQTGEELIIKRVTDISAAKVVFTGGAGATKSDLNAATLQMIYALDELQHPADVWTDTLTYFQVQDRTHRHNLGDDPTRLEVWAECTSGDLNYATGEFINLATGADVAPLLRSLTSGFLATNVTSFSFKLRNIASGVYEALDDTKWKVHVYTWR